MVASSVGAGCSSLPGPFVQRVKVGPEAFGIILSHSVPAIDPILGPRSQERDRIGANGVMVLRLRVPSKALAGSCRLQRRTRQRRERRRYFHCEQLLFTLRRSRGAIGRYQRPTGALLVAPGVPRRPMDGADGLPGTGKGLKNSVNKPPSTLHLHGTNYALTYSVRLSVVVVSGGP